MKKNNQIIAVIFAIALIVFLAYTNLKTAKEADTISFKRECSVNDPVCEAKAISDCNSYFYEGRTKEVLLCDPDLCKADIKNTGGNLTKVWDESCSVFKK